MANLLANSSSIILLIYKILFLNYVDKMKLIKKLVLLLVLVFSLNMAGLTDYKKQCDNGNSKGCSNLGSMYIQGKGVKKDYFKAVEYYQKACDLNSGDGCVLLGSMYGLGAGVKQSDLKAVEYYQKACDLDDGESCFDIGFMYYAGIGIRQSKTKALEYFGKACNLKSKDGCKYYSKPNNK
jgi:hypothetical protein